ncbi:polysaccharide deacetylase family protein [Kordia sp. YSTF-M3]|uniref:Polysaccharide deacetylase family protein n=1 Tax=Kordia aestuariivivens TaxID=2759037 RepID=A0ABR7Q3C9_9FLAO|nr:polysaccharide deacetylase family protein [Kordia aestuariivivens]MBC8753055.1 polysaccharide deacetylase family protein [Kordia aestuariivivens]
MKLYTAKTPKLVKWLFPSLVWEFSVTEKKIYLTFDDGPIPEVTPWVLEQLAVYNAKATFFCIGDNVQKHPAIYNEIISQGHAIGNHTQHHVNAWKVSNETYLSDTKLAHESLLNALESHQNIPVHLFRPPYGKITPQLSKKLRKLGYKIIMWNVLSGDFDKDLSQEKCLAYVMNNTEAGSIIVFHDSLKAYNKLTYVLPKILKHFSNLGYTFDRITI